jgi:CDGSH-type Zn-finger protein/uncharacterized Fe-S cluster protein YjdI
MDKSVASVAEAPSRYPGTVSRERLLHALYEAAELEHNLMCTYLYAAFSLKSGVAEGLTSTEADAVARWRREILSVAVDEMSHMTAVWNITAALGGVPRFGRTNFPLDPGYLPACVVVKLAPFSASVVQHFIYLERPHGSREPDGEGFEPERRFVRGAAGDRLTPMGLDYETVGEFYAALSAGLSTLVDHVGEAAAFGGDAALQLSEQEVSLAGARRVICLKTALAAFDAIVREGEGAPAHSEGSHFSRFCRIRSEFRALMQANPAFVPNHPAAINPVLRRPPRPEGRVWIEHEPSIAVVDLANAAYGLMLRLLGYAYAVPAPDPDRPLAVDLSLGLMRAVTGLGEHAARLPAGPSNPDCNAGMSFTVLRDTAPLPPGPAARRFFIERLSDLAAAAEALPVTESARLAMSARVIRQLAGRARKSFDLSARRALPQASQATTLPTGPSPTEPSTIAQGIETVEGRALTLMFEAKRCIHARFCVTGAPTVFLANVQGPWLHPDTLDVERLTAIAQECPSGAIRYRRKDGRPDESPPPVNLASIREGGPYALRGQLKIGGESAGFRATLCRCGASKNKPFCDGSHHEIGFSATGEPPTGAIDTLPVRDGPLDIDPLIDGPLQIRGNLEITSGTGRVVARVTTVRLCRCGGSSTKPFCDGTHASIGFRS